MEFAFLGANQNLKLVRYNLCLNISVNLVIDFFYFSAIFSSEADLVDVDLQKTVEKTFIQGSKSRLLYPEDSKILRCKFPVSVFLNLKMSNKKLSELNWYVLYTGRRKISRYFRFCILQHSATLLLWK